MKYLNKFVFALLYSLIPFVMQAQKYLPISEDVLSRYVSQIYSDSLYIHSAIKPFLVNDFKGSSICDSTTSLSSNRPAIEYLLNNNLLGFTKNNFCFSLNPVLSSIQTAGINDHSFYHHAEIGFQSNLEITNKHAFNYNFSINRSDFLPEVDNWINYKKVIAHYGTYKKSGEFYTYLSSSFYWSYITGKYFTFLVGSGKHFWGDGYRSLLLSDNSRNYPFVQASLNIWKIKYVVLYSFLKDIHYPDPAYILENKYTTSHLLSWNATNWLNLGLFETVIWKSDETNNYRGFDINYMNPVIFFRPVEFSIDNPSPDNVLMGAFYKIKPREKTYLYGQFILDEFNLAEIRKNEGYWGNKYGIQVGFKRLDLFSVKNLFLQGELNLVRPFTYSHITSLENYGNYHQPLAHPLGANFVEYLAIARYHWSRFFISSKFIISQQGIDENTVNSGSNIYRTYNERQTDYGHSLLQGDLRKFVLLDTKVSYLVNPKMYLYLELGFKFCSTITSEYSYKHNLLYLGFKTSLQNNEIDF